MEPLKEALNSPLFRSAGESGCFRFTGGDCRLEGRLTGGRGSGFGVEGGGGVRVQYRGLNNYKYLYYFGGFLIILIL